MKFRSASTLAFGALFSLLFGTAACSGANPGNAGSAGNSGAGVGASDAGGSNGGGMGGSAGTDIGFGAMGGGAGTGGVPFTECAKATQAPSTLPLQIYIAVDKSGSMGDNGKWDAAKAAFTGFFQDPANAADQISVALRFWPDGQCNEVTCNVAACEQPQVNMGPLSDPAQVQALLNLYNSKQPNGNTPMFAALGGAATWAIDNAPKGEGAVKTVILFVTDGEPNGCDENINDIAQNAANAYQSVQVPTFAVGLAGSNESQMTTIAVAGNTQKPFLIGNGNAAADLTAALKEIQKSTLACVFAMPEAMGPDPIDPQQVNLTYKPLGASKSITIGQVDSEAGCSAAGGWGWYYDDPVNPSVIQLCPALCDNVQKDDSGVIEVVLGCDTKPA